MAEYLAPGVYTEETPSNKPIEGVSTSTAGLVGVTERGPLDVPQLVTSFGEFRRQFGDLLPAAPFTDAGRCHGYLPHAVEGFFTNGGKRCYLTRVVPPEATRAATTMFYADAAVSPRGQTVLLRAAAPQSGTALSGPRLYPLDPANFAIGDRVRIGDGSRAEFGRIVTVGAAAHASLRQPLVHAHPSGAATQLYGSASDVNFDTLALKTAAAAGDIQVAVTGADVGNFVVGTPAAAAQPLLRVGTGLDLEAVFVTVIANDGPGPDKLLALGRPLARAHAAATAVSCPAAPAAGTLSVAANAGDSLVFGPASGAVGEVLVVERGSPQQDVGLTGRLATLPLAVPLPVELPVGTPAEAFTAAADARQVASLITASRIPLDNVAGIAAGQTLTSAGSTQTITAVDVLLGIVTLAAPLAAAPASGAAVTVNPGGLTPTVDDWPTARVVPLAQPVATVTPGMALTAEPPGADTGTVVAVLPDVGVVVLALPFPAAINAGTPLRIGGALYTARALASASVVPLNDASGLAPGQQLTIGAETRAIAAVNAALQAVALQAPLSAVPAPGTAVQFDLVRLAAAAGAGATTLSLNSRLGLQAGDVLRVGTVDTEFVAINRVLGESGPAPDAGMVQIGQALAHDHAALQQVTRERLAALGAARPPAALVLAAPAGATQLLVPDGTGFAANDVLRLQAPDGSSYFHLLSGPATLAAPREVALADALGAGHPAGATFAEREQLFEVQALDVGDWGNRLQVSARAEETGLVAGASVLSANPPPAPGMFSSLQLASLTGVEAGTVLQLVQADGMPVAGAPLLKARHVDRATRLVLLDAPGLQPAHIAAVTAGLGAGTPARVRSLEFILSVLLLQRADPAVPSRNETVIDQEVFRQLSMDLRHSRYIERVLGVTFADGSDADDRNQPVRRSDRRSEGASTLVRVRDLGSPAQRVAIRVSPELMTDTLPSGLTRAARQPLAGGDDAVAQMGDAMYLGADSNEPAHRRGLHTLKNLLAVALVAVPGQTTVPVQQAVIDHCEAMRYRFAVLDGPAPDQDTVADVLLHRSQYDTRYAALYHPWLLVDDPFPASLATTPELALPPSGHVLGLYARVDNDRGVHKAPANEVVRGIKGLARSFAKGEQDILNPYPTHINVIRDFRPNNRGLRVWGARCITSDSEYKYVNVRRLMIFIEDSLDRGLQWVVFEPNAEELWARVRRSISNFLTTVWRNGALEGSTIEQAFFVKCDRTTMTRDDLDNGRLVCVVGVAPVRPAEFVIVRIGLWTADAQA
jgi:phage tail sheath protein FI